MLLAAHTLLASALAVPLDDWDGNRNGVEAIGDVNGDGVSDIAVANRRLELPETIWILSGADGSELLRFSGARKGDGFGRALAPAGDVNGDGVADVVVGAYDDRWETTYGDRKTRNGRIQAEDGPSGYVHVVSGFDGRVLLSLSSGERGDFFGFSVAGGSDVDGDRIPDILVGAPRTTNDEDTGLVLLYSGATGELLRSFDGIGRYGTCVQFSPDSDGDGNDDVLIGAPAPRVSIVFGGDPLRAQNATRTQASGFAEIRSSATGKSLREFRIESDVPPGTRSPQELAAPTFQLLGWTVACVADQDDDEHFDVVAADIRRDHVFLFSGKSGDSLGRLPSPRHMYIYTEGTTLAALPDHDGDGVGDVLIAANEWGDDPGLARIQNGRTGAILAQFEPDLEQDRERPGEYGVDACSPGDLDGDGRPDLIVTIPDKGRLYAYSGADPVAKMFEREPLYAVDLLALPRAGVPDEKR